MDATPLISLRDITKHYVQGDMRTDVLRGVTLDIGSGEFVALQGPSGSGKSTLLHIIGLLDRASSGSYLLGGRDVSRLDDDALSELRNQVIGFVFQSFYLIPYASALDNVMLPGLYSGKPQAELRDRARFLLEQVGLADRMRHKPPQLSGGQQQRVALARAMLSAPDLILADEPTGQLDSKTSAEIMSLFAQVNALGTTVIVVTHDEETASHAKRRILVLDGVAA
ncbi:ABC transporter ATP-binding protein [Fundidesulfovibrio terrae]|uniref:ABC transporter ATP-binding protein n=1 Tax=Fundidesulfovibrio terrae TaxID=2922866 RepID=UPI00243487DF|nr:ABC transporter ATP-binding protein [Fundidesulfovibrio terrae]